MSNAGAGSGGPAGAGAGGPAQLTPEDIKELTHRLTDMARADGLHDFGRSIGPVLSDDDINVAFLSSVPGTSRNDWGETETLNNSFIQSEFRRTLEQAVDPTKTVELPTDFTTHTKINYSVTAVPFQGPPDKVTRFLSGKTLAEELFGPEEAGYPFLQVDFNHHGFLARLQGDPEDSMKQARKVGYMWSAATVNDPASKTDPSMSVFGHGDVTIIVHQQTSGTTSFGNTKQYDPDDASNNFMSKYGVELSGIQTKGIFGKKKKQSVSIKFQYGAETAVVNDSKGQNSIGELTPFIVNLINKLANYRTDRAVTPARKLQFELATKWMQKRSGDWLQALHAKMYQTLTYDIPIEGDAVPFFVSHDQIAIAYALSMGVPCLYFFTYPTSREEEKNKVDYIVVFDNRPRSKEARESQAEKRAEACKTNLTGEAGRVTKLWEWYEKIKKARNDSLGEKERQVNGAITRLETGDFDSVKTLEDLLREILGLAMEYTYLETAVPDDFVDPQEPITPASACAKYNSYRGIERLQTLHGEMNDADSITIPQSFFKVFQKSKIYKTLVQWDIEAAVSETSGVPTRTIPALERSVGRVAQNPQGQNLPSDPRDRFAFLAFIANSRNSTMKDKLARAFLTFEASFLSPAVTVVNTIGTTVMENNLDRIGARSANRKNRVEAGLRNILSQGYVYLKTSESDLPEYSSAVASIINAAVGFPSRQPDVSNPADRVDTVPPISFFDRVKLLLSRVAKMFIPDRYGPRDTSAAGSTGSAGAGSGAPPAEGNEDPEAGQAATAKGGGQRGGWTEGSKPVDRRDLDKSQMSSPALFALVEIGLPVLVAYLPDYPEWSEYPQSGGGGGYLKSKGWTQPREGVWRDPLTLLDYTEDVATGFQRARETQKGGAVDTEKDSWIESFNNVMEPLLIIAAEQIITDTDDMKEATVGQREYYTRGLDLLTAIQGEKPSIQLALATYELLCCSRFVTTTEFKNALGIDDPYEAKTIQLFFSGLESYSYRERPAIDTRSFLTNLKPLYARVRSNTAVKTAEEIRKDAETIVAVIMKKYEVEEVVKPTLTASSSAEEPTDVLNTSLTRGQTQDPGALEKSFSTPEVRPTQSAGKRRPLFTTP